jgi:LPXTG-site transpeptidase (sortase) family protein
MNSFATIQSALDVKKTAITVGVVLAVVIMVYPFLPAMQYSFNADAGAATLGNFESTGVVLATNNYVLLGSAEEQRLGFENRIAGLENMDGWSLAGMISGAGDDAHLSIPKIGVEMPIAVTQNENQGLDKGAWLMPGTSTPDKGGNTAFAAHRFRYVPPSSKTFYLLDKLTIGDEVQVVWQGKEYWYEVTESKIVSPNATEVLDDKGHPTITLITCDPIFSTSNRLVVTATLIEVR